MKLLGVLEGILFLVGDEGLSLKTISEILKINETETKDLLTKLKEEYEKEDRGLRVTYLGDSFKLTTKKEHREYFTLLTQAEETNNLTPSQLETLAIVAYNQPITRAEVDSIRGVSSAFMIRKLVAKGMLIEIGKSPLPGRPNLYGTTKEFLDYFGLATINDLPLVDHALELQDDVDLFKSIYKEDA